MAQAEADGRQQGFALAAHGLPVDAGRPREVGDGIVEPDAAVLLQEDEAQHVARQETGDIGLGEALHDEQDREDGAIQRPSHVKRVQLGMGVEVLPHEDVESESLLAP